MRVVAIALGGWRPAEQCREECNKPNAFAQMSARAREWTLIKSIFAICMDANVNFTIRKDFAKLRAVPDAARLRLWQRLNTGRRAEGGCLKNLALHTTSIYWQPRRADWRREPRWRKAGPAELIQHSALSRTSSMSAQSAVSWALPSEFGPELRLTTPLYSRCRPRCRIALLSGIEGQELIKPCSKKLVAYKSRSY